MSPAGVTPDHSANFPQSYELCGGCGRRGVYAIRAVWVPGSYPRGSAVRCKFCQRYKSLDGTTPLPLRLEADLIAIPLYGSLGR